MTNTYDASRALKSIWTWGLALLQLLRFCKLGYPAGGWVPTWGEAPVSPAETIILQQLQLVHWLTTDTWISPAKMSQILDQKKCPGELSPNCYPVTNIVKQWKAVLNHTKFWDVLLHSKSELIHLPTESSTSQKRQREMLISVWNKLPPSHLRMEESLIKDALLPMLGVLTCVSPLFHPQFLSSLYSPDPCTLVYCDLTVLQRAQALTQYNWLIFSYLN